MKKSEFANIVDSDKAAQNEPPYQDPQCLSSLNSEFDKT